MSAPLTIPAAMLEQIREYTLAEKRADSAAAAVANTPKGDATNKAIEQMANARIDRDVHARGLARRLALLLEEHER